MTAIAAARGDVTRWLASAVVVVGLHAAGVAALLAWHDPLGVGDASPAVVVDLAPYAPPSESTEDVAPGPIQQQAAAPAPQTVEPKPEDKPDETVAPRPEEKVEAKTEPRPEQKPEEKIEVPPAPVPPIAAMPPPEAVPPPPEPKAQPAPASDIPPAPVTTAPPRPHEASARETNKWYTGIRERIEHHRAYPPTARARREIGVVQVAFSIDRQGRLITHRVAHASGYPSLDQAAIATLEKAQPFPAPPADMPGEEFTFTVPVSFSLR